MSKLQTLLYSFFIACLFLLAKGYHFNTEDQAEHLPQVYALLDNSLYHKDAFVQASLHHFTIRYFYTWFLFGVSHVMPVSLACFLLTLFCITTVAWAFMQIAKCFSNNMLAAYLSPVLVLFLFLGYTVGGNVIQYNQFICSSAGKALASLALLCFFRRQYMKMAFLLGFATLFHALVGLQLFILLALLLLWVEKFSLAKKTGVLAAYCCIAGFILIPVFLHQSVAGSDLYYNILYRFRNPLHYLPSLFPVKDYLKLTLLLVAAVLALYKSSIPAKANVAKLLVLLVAGLVVYTIALEVLQIQAIGKLQWFKTSIWLAGMCSVILAVYIAEFLTDYILKLTIAPGHLCILLGLAISCMLFILCNSAVLPINKIQGRFMTGNYKKSDLTKLHEWIAKNTPKDALILTPPDDDAFLCEAKRASAISYKAIIHEPYFLLPWYAKFSGIYGVNINTPGKEKAIDKAVALYRTRKYSGDATIMYRIDNFAECTYSGSLGAVVHREGDWVLSVY